MDTPDVTGAPSAPAATAPTAADQALASGDVSAYKAARHAERTGTPLDPKDPTTTAASSAATAVQDPPAPTGAKPEPASKSAKNADTRVQELLADRAAERLRAERAERELEQLRTKPAQPDAKPAASSPAAATDPADPEPDPTNAKYPEGQFDRQYLKDQARWEARQEYTAREAVTRQSQETARQEQAQEQRERAHDQKEAQFMDRYKAEQIAHPDLVASIDPKLGGLRPSITLKPGERPTFGHVVADVLLDSAHPVQLMAHLSDLAEQQRLSQLSERAFYLEIGRIEAKFEQAPAPPNPKPLTSAPAPPTTLGSRPADTADPVDRALKNGDVLAYKAARHKQRLAEQR